MRDALLSGKASIKLWRNDFIESAIAFADALRVRKPPEVEHIDEKILNDLHSLLPLRDQLIDWLNLEASLQEPLLLEGILTTFLEKLLALKCRPPELTAWEEPWFDTHRIFAYEVFLYVIALLVKADRYTNIRGVLTTHYLLPESGADLGGDFAAFDAFYTNSQALKYRNDRLKMNRLSMIADIVKERANRSDLPFNDIMQAELIVLLAVLLSDEHRWYPHTLVYSGRGKRFPVFVRAAQHKYFSHLHTITGAKSGDELRENFRQGCDKHHIGQWEMFFWSHVSLWNSMNMDAIDTID